MEARRNKALKEADADLQREDMLVGKVFTSPDGDSLLRILKARFCPVTIFDPNPIKMAYMEGQRSVVETFIRAAEWCVTLHKKGE